MRFIYGLILGILATLIGSILYLAIGGGEYLLVLSPKYHEMRSSIDSLQKAEQQRDQLAGKLDALEKKFNELAQRYSELHAASKNDAPVANETARPPD